MSHQNRVHQTHAGHQPTLTTRNTDKTGTSHEQLYGQNRTDSAPFISTAPNPQNQTQLNYENSAKGHSSNLEVTQSGSRSAHPTIIGLLERPPIYSQTVYVKHIMQGNTHFLKMEGKGNNNISTNTSSMTFHPEKRNVQDPVDNATRQLVDEARNEFINTNTHKKRPKRMNQSEQYFQALQRTYQNKVSSTEKRSAPQITDQQDIVTNPQFNNISCGPAAKRMKPSEETTGAAQALQPNQQGVTRPFIPVLSTANCVPVEQIQHPLLNESRKGSGTYKLSLKPVLKPPKIQPKNTKATSRIARAATQQSPKIQQEHTSSIPSPDHKAKTGSGKCSSSHKSTHDSSNNAIDESEIDTNKTLSVDSRPTNSNNDDNRPTNSNNDIYDDTTKDIDCLQQAVNVTDNIGFQECKNSLLVVLTRLDDKVISNSSTVVSPPKSQTKDCILKSSYTHTDATKDTELENDSKKSSAPDMHIGIQKSISKEDYENEISGESPIKSVIKCPSLKTEQPDNEKDHEKQTSVASQHQTHLNRCESSAKQALFNAKDQPAGAGTLITARTLPQLMPMTGPAIHLPTTDVSVSTTKALIQALSTSVSHSRVTSNSQALSSKQLMPASPATQIKLKHPLPLMLSRDGKLSSVPKPITAEVFKYLMSNGPMSGLPVLPTFSYGRKLHITPNATLQAKTDPKTALLKRGIEPSAEQTSIKIEPPATKNCASSKDNTHANNCQTASILQSSSKVTTAVIPSDRVKVGGITSVLKMNDKCQLYIKGMIDIGSSKTPTNFRKDSRYVYIQPNSLLSTKKTPVPGPEKQQIGVSKDDKKYGTDHAYIREKKGTKECALVTPNDSLPEKSKIQSNASKKGKVQGLDLTTIKQRPLLPNVDKKQEPSISPKVARDISISQNTSSREDTLPPSNNSGIEINIDMDREVNTDPKDRSTDATNKVAKTCKAEENKTSKSDASVTGVDSTTSHAKGSSDSLDKETKKKKLGKKRENVYVAEGHEKVPKYMQLLNLYPANHVKRARKSRLQKYLSEGRASRRKLKMPLGMDLSPRHRSKVCKVDRISDRPSSSHQNCVSPRKGLTTKQDALVMSKSAKAVQLLKSSNTDCQVYMHHVKINIIAGGTDASLHRWFQFSDYPCVLHLGESDAIRQIDAEKLVSGFYVISHIEKEATNSLFIASQPRTKSAILSAYPPHVPSLQDGTMALAIGNIYDTAEDTAAVFRQCKSKIPCSSVEKVLRLVLDAHLFKDISNLCDDRYDCRPDVVQSPRLTSAKFYSPELFDFFTPVNNGSQYDSRGTSGKSSTSTDTNSIDSNYRKQNIAPQTVETEEEKSSIIKQDVHTHTLPGIYSTPEENGLTETEADLPLDLSLPKRNKSAFIASEMCCDDTKETILKKDKTKDAVAVAVAKGHIEGSLTTETVKDLTHDVDHMRASSYVEKCGLAICTDNANNSSLDLSLKDKGRRTRSQVKMEQKLGSE